MADDLSGMSDKVLDELLAKQKELLDREFKLTSAWMDENFAKTKMMKPPRAGDIPERDQIAKELDALGEKIQSRRTELKGRRNMNLSAPNEDMSVYENSEEWVPDTKINDVQHSGAKDFPPPVRNSAAPKRGELTKSGARVMSIGDWIKDSIENPGSLTLGFGEGARVTEYSPTDPDIPTRATGRYAYRATGPEGYAWSNTPGKTVDDYLEKAMRGGDSSLDDFIQAGFIRSEYTPRAFFSLGSADPNYITGRGHVTVLDTQRARYTASTGTDDVFDEWSFRNPQYTTLEANIPKDASPLQRAAWAANPMNRRGIAIFPQIQNEIPAEVSLAKDSPNVRRAFVLNNYPGWRPSDEINQLLTTDTLDAVNTGGMNQFGQSINTFADPAEELLKNYGIAVDTSRPVYDRVTPFTQRPIGTHLANLRTEARIAANTVPALARQSAIATGRTIAANPGKILGTAGFLADLSSNWQHSYYSPEFKNDEYRGLASLADAVETSAVNLVNPVHYIRGIQGIGNAVMQIDEPRRATALPASPQAIMAMAYREAGKKPTYSAPLHESEKRYFEQNPNVSGMATEDGRVIFNPAWEKNATDEQKRGLYMLESSRIFMRNNDTWKDVELTPEQRAYFASMPNSQYSRDENLAKQTLLSRIIGGDEIPNAPYTDEQRFLARKIGSAMSERRNQNINISSEEPLRLIEPVLREYYTK